jgi:hypothetical protein
MFWFKKAVKPQKTTITKVPKGDIMNPDDLKYLEVIPGQFVKLTHPAIAGLEKVFHGGEKIVEESWGLAKGYLLSNNAGAVVQKSYAPVVTSGTEGN